ncbi:MAG TPA: hypothetical protein VFO19_10770 [Vicinamibacterales bacterium]|nr:hypothetical protein [Vicinamibacterales bacterium]
MGDVYRSHACTEREALERLAAEAELGPDRLSLARIDFDASIHRRITLWLPDVVGQSHPPASAVGLDEGLARLLVNGTADPRRAAAPSGERLFMSTRVSADAVVATLRRLERFATPARVARLQSSTGAYDDVWLLHVLVDRGRHSGFSGLEALGLFEAWQSFSAYESEGCRLFLTAGVPIARDLLPPLWRLMSNENAAALLALAPQGPRDERFYVLARTDDIGASFERIALPPLAFVDSIEVGFALDASVRVASPGRGAEPANLAQHLRDRAPSRGYRLTLESTRAIEEAGRDLDRLRSQQAYLAQRVAYAESLHRPRPRLLRFTTGQLAALAHTIYSFAPDSLFRARPHLRYAFRATPHEPVGRHYLWVDPEAVRRTPDPLPLYDNTPPMRFWLDPTWGRHYHDDGGGAGCVFVPEHTALAPPLHSWVPGDIDEHLRRVFARSEDQAGAGAVYVLDREPGDAGGLELTVFEREAFMPIDASVNWLNDNITAAGRIDVADLVRDAAAATRADLLDTAAAGAAASSRRDFRLEAARTRERFLKDLDAVISTINRCTFEVLQRAHLAIDGMKSLDHDMDGLADIRERSRGIASVSDLLNGVDGVTRALRDRVSALEHEVGEALRQAEAQSENEQRRIESFIQSLEDRRADLRRRLHGTN